MKKILLTGLAALVVAMPAWSQDREDIASATFTTDPQPVTAPAWIMPEGSEILVDNGPLITGTATGVGGADESILQSVSLGMTLLGFGHQQAAGNRIADDFTVPGSVVQWDIDQCTFFAYQSFAPNTGTISGVTLRIWDGPPGDITSTLVWGDDTTNIMSSTGWTNVYRVTETTTGTSADRAIQASSATLGLSLTPGDYWFDWATDGDAGFSGPWAPPVTVPGLAATGNGLQSVDGGLSYAPALDGASQQAFPFVCTGTPVTVNPIDVPTLGETGLLTMILLLAGFAVVRMRRS